MEIKCKTKIQGCQLNVKIKIPSSERVNERELNFVVEKHLRGIMKPTLKKSFMGTQIIFTGPVGISLAERLKKQITKFDFLFIIEQIVDISEKLQKNAMSWDKVVWDTHSIFINEKTREMHFIYLPFEHHAEKADFFGLFDQIIYSAKPAQNESSDYISKFVYHLKSMREYDPAKIEAFVNVENSEVVKIIKKHYVGDSGFMTDKQADYYKHYRERNTIVHDGSETELLDPRDDPDATWLLQEDTMEETEPVATGCYREYSEATGLLSEESPIYASEETGLLNENNLSNTFGSEYEETGLLVEEDNESMPLYENTGVRFPKLTRVRTEEIIEINKPVFRLGKEKSYSDYFVNNNNAVSRSHADIITRGEHYFVKDLNSKNRTFINNIPLSVQQETEIFDGDRLKLANEEFIFYQ